MSALQGQKGVIALLELGVPFEDRREDRYNKSQEFQDVRLLLSRAARISRSPGIDLTCKVLRRRTTKHGQTQRRRLQPPPLWVGALAWHILPIA